LRPRVTLAVLFLVNVLNIYDRQVLGAILEPLRREFRLTDAQLGALPTIFTVVYAIAGLPLGRLADRWSRKRLLAAGVAVWGCLTGLGGLAASYGFLFVTRMGVGIGEAVCAPAATSWIGDVVPTARRAKAMAGFMMAVPVGVMLSFAISGPVAQAHGWRAAMALAAAPTLVLVPVLLLLDEPDVRVTDSPAHGSIYGFLARVPALRWIAVSGAIVNFVLYSFSTFIAAFLTRVHGLSVARAGVWSGIGSGVAGILGALAAGALGDRARDSGRIRFAAWAAMVSAIPAAIAISLPRGTATAAVALLMLAYGLLQMYYGLLYAAIQDIVPAGMRGSAMAGYFMVMYLCGGSFGPLVTGALSDRFGLQHAMYVVPALSLALAFVLWGAARAIAPARPVRP
jgi:predicted MFS family arabinose efflux permease